MKRLSFAVVAVAIYALGVAGAPFVEGPAPQPNRLLRRMQRSGSPGSWGRRPDNQPLPPGYNTGHQEVHPQGDPINDAAGLPGAPRPYVYPPLGPDPIFYDGNEGGFRTPPPYSEYLGGLGATYHSTTDPAHENAGTEPPKIDIDREIEGTEDERLAKYRFRFKKLEELGRSKAEGKRLSDDNQKIWKDWRKNLRKTKGIWKPGVWDGQDNPSSVGQITDAAKAGRLAAKIRTSSVSQDAGNALPSAQNAGTEPPNPYILTTISRKGKERYAQIFDRIKEVQRLGQLRKEGKQLTTEGGGLYSNHNLATFKGIWKDGAWGRQTKPTYKDISQAAQAGTLVDKFDTSLLSLQNAGTKPPNPAEAEALFQQVKEVQELTSQSVGTKLTDVEKNRLKNLKQRLKTKPIWVEGVWDGRGNPSSKITKAAEAGTLVKNFRASLLYQSDDNAIPSAQEAHEDARSAANTLSETSGSIGPANFPPPPPGSALFDFNSNPQLTLVKPGSPVKPESPTEDTLPDFDPTTLIDADVKVALEQLFGDDLAAGGASGNPQLDSANVYHNYLPGEGNNYGGGGGGYGGGNNYGGGRHGGSKRQKLHRRGFDALKKAANESPAPTVALSPEAIMNKTGNVQQYMETWKLIKENATNILWPYLTEMLSGTNSTLMIEAAMSIYAQLLPTKWSVVGPFFYGLTSLPGLNNSLTIDNQTGLVKGSNWAIEDLVVNTITINRYSRAYNNGYHALNESGCLEDLRVLNYAIGYFNQTLPFDQEYEDGIGNLFKKYHRVIPANEQLQPNASASNSSSSESIEALNAALYYRFAAANSNRTALTKPTAPDSSHQIR